MHVQELLSALHEEAARRVYVVRLEILDQTPSLVKARLYISQDLLVQVYRNDRFDTTNLVLVYNGQRLYARDQLGGLWHRHTRAEPDMHDTSQAGSRPVSLSEFLDEVESVLADLDLP